MSKIKVAINGFGRIGRTSARAMLKMQEIEIIAINDLTDTQTLAHLFKYDSVHGQYQGTVSRTENTIIIDEKIIDVFSELDPSKLRWKELGVDIVIEATGHFLDHVSASKHLLAGAKKVIISAPPKDDSIKTIVLGINDQILSEQDKIISNASCTTNCAAPMIHVLRKNWGIKKAFITTVHSYTGDQRLHDAPHKDLRRARSAALSIIPTSTGAAKAITKIFPKLEGKIGGGGIRVPVPNGSLTDITCFLKLNPTVEDINNAFKSEAEGRLKGIVEYLDAPIVSIDIVGNTHSCVFDPKLTSVIGNMVKVIGWYDNESGYSQRLADLVLKIGKYPNKESGKNRMKDLLSSA